MKYESLLPDRFYHIYNRGNNREDLFFEEKNYSYFLHLLQRHISPVAQVFAYCLLKNHFHLVVRTHDEVEELKISKAFSNLFNAYAKAINKAYNRRGSLFQDRFKRILIDDERYLLNLIVYIHQNPQNHKIVEDFTGYRHSPFIQICSDKPGIVEKEEVLNLFGDRQNFIEVHKIKSQQDLTGLGDL